jgi:phage gp36-like protein
MELYFGTTELLIAADRDGDGSLDTSVVSTALTNASEEMDSYIGVRYELPLTTTTPTVLKNYCCDIAMYRLSIESASLTDDKRTRYEDALTWLSRLAGGKVTLGTTDASEETDAAPELHDDNPVRQFTRAKLEGLW